MRDLDAIQHEACHVVVGIALGLRLRKAAISKESRDGWKTSGYAWFTSHGSALAHAIMYAAGVVWEQAHGRESPLDYKYMLEELSIKDGDNVPGAEQAEVRTCLRLAKYLLKDRMTAHKQVTKALLDRDLTDKDIRAIARGEKITEAE
jgi:hypothetical protein